MKKHIIIIGFLFLSSNVFSQKSIVSLRYGIGDINAENVVDHVLSNKNRTEIVLKSFSNVPALGVDFYLTDGHGGVATCDITYKNNHFGFSDKSFTVKNYFSDIDSTGQPILIVDSAKYEGASNYAHIKVGYGLDLSNKSKDVICFLTVNGEVGYGSDVYFENIYNNFFASNTNYTLNSTGYNEQGKVEGMTTVFFGASVKLNFGMYLTSEKDKPNVALGISPSVSYLFSTDQNPMFKQRRWYPDITLTISQIKMRE